MKSDQVQQPFPGQMQNEGLRSSTSQGPNETSNEDHADRDHHVDTLTHSQSRFKATYLQLQSRIDGLHQRTPYLRRIPLRAILIILLLVAVNLVVWAICGLVLTRYPRLLSTAALAYSLGLRHALDADHISAIDLMTRRLIASGQRPVTVGTFFSLGHSTIVIITSIAVAATAAGVSKRFNRFSKVGGIIGSSVSASFLILLGIMNAYILYKLLIQLRKVIHMQPEEEETEAFRIEGGGVLFRLLKRMFKLIDRPWKMYPLGVMFGLGFDTSSEVALLGISSIQGAKGTSIWLILIFPVLFTVGMCLVDTIDGALMMGLYVAPMGAQDSKPPTQADSPPTNPPTTQDLEEDPTNLLPPPPPTQTLRVKSPLTFLYYSSVLTSLTVLVALVIGTIQLLTLILNVAVSDDDANSSPFWRGVQTAGDYYDVIGGAICASFVVFGLLSVVCYKPWRAWVEEVRIRERGYGRRGTVELVGNAEEGGEGDGGRDDGAARLGREEMAGSSRVGVTSRSDAARSVRKGQTSVTVSEA